MCNQSKESDLLSPCSRKMFLKVWYSNICIRTSYYTCKRFSFLGLTPDFLNLNFSIYMPEICMYNNFQRPINVIVSEQDDLEILSVC